MNSTQSRLSSFLHDFLNALCFWHIPDAEASTTHNILFYHTDHLGSSNLITDSAGVVVELNEHTPYGSLSRHEGTEDVPQDFTGQRLDKETSLHFYNARYYDSELGRFTSPDPFVQAPSDPQTLNWYSYVRNNPINYVDPSGNIFLIDDFILFVIGFAVYTAVVGTASYYASEAIVGEGEQGSISISSQSSPSQQSSSIRIKMPTYPNPITGFIPGSEVKKRVIQPLQSFARASSQIEVEAAKNLGEFGVSPEAVVIFLLFGGKSSFKAAYNFEYSFGPGDIYHVRTYTATSDIYGSNFSYVNARDSIAAIEGIVTSPYSKGTLSFNRLAFSRKFGSNLAKGGLGGSFNLSGHIVRTASEIDIITLGNTTYSFFSEGGYGAMAKMSLIVDQDGGQIGFGGGLGPTAAFEIRFRRLGARQP